MRRGIVIRIVVLVLGAAVLSVPAAWADQVPSASSSAPQPLIVPVLHSTEHGSPGSTRQPLIVPMRPSSEHGGTVAVPAVVMVGPSRGFDWTSAGIGAFGALGLALMLVGAVAVRARRARVA